MPAFGTLDVGTLFLDFEDKPRAWIKTEDDGLANARSGMLSSYFDDEAQVQLDTDLYDIQFNCSTGARHYFKKGNDVSLCNVSINRGVWADARVPMITCNNCAKKFYDRHNIWPDMSSRVVRRKDDEN